MNKLILGIGNVGKEYLNTRHNIGFIILDEIANNNKLTFKEDKNLNCYITKFNYKGNKAFLVKPTTFVNLSGESLVKVMNYYKIDIEDVLVLVDDVNLSLGSLRLRIKGSAGGHNGLKNIESHLHTQEYKRIRVGVGNDEKKDLVNHVLGKFKKVELPKLEPTVENAIFAVYDFINNIPFLDIMTQYNKKNDE